MLALPTRLVPFASWGPQNSPCAFRVCLNLLYKFVARLITFLQFCLSPNGATRMLKFALSLNIGTSLPRAPSHNESLTLLHTSSTSLCPNYTPNRAKCQPKIPKNFAIHKICATLSQNWHWQRISMPHYR